MPHDCLYLIKLTDLPGIRVRNSIKQYCVVIRKVGKTTIVCCGYSYTRVRVQHCFVYRYCFLCSLLLRWFVCVGQFELVLVRWLVGSLGGWLVG